MDTPGKRIRWALKQRKLSAAELGRRLGITRSAVSQWWSGQNPTSPLEKLPQIANELQVYENWLLTGEGEALRERKRFPSGGQGKHPLAPETSQAPVVGIVEGEVWREGPVTKQQILRQAENLQGQEGDGGVTVPHYPRPDVAGLKQFAFEIRGASCDKVARNGEYVICVDYDSVRPDGFSNGDTVVIQKRRDNEYKLLITRAQYRSGGWEFHYESNDPRWQNEKPIRLTKDKSGRWHDSADRHEVIPLGYVLGIFRAYHLPGAPLLSTATQ